MDFVAGSQDKILWYTCYSQQMRKKKNKTTQHNRKLSC